MFTNFFILDSSRPNQPPSSVNSDGKTDDQQLTKLDPVVQMDLEFILEKNLDAIITRYASYVDTLRGIIEERGVSPEALRSYLLSLTASSNGSKGQ